MIELKLTKGKVAIIDKDDIEISGGLKWHYQKKSKTGYAIRSIIKNGKKTTERLHRLILNAKTGEIVDHIDGDGLNCRRSNLRIVSIRQNSINRRSKPRSSGFKGVSKVKWKSGEGEKILWHARICPNRQCRTLGYFKSKNEAAKAYDREAIKIYGEFAVLNFNKKEN